MRTLLSVVLAVCVSASVFSVRQVQTAEAAFHCMRIHAVMGGFNGDNNIQYVELRMEQGSQTLLTGHKIQFFDAGGTLRATFTFPSVATNGLTGDSILIATSEFNSNVTGGAADFVFSGANTTGPSALHPVSLTGGSVVWANQAGDFNCAVGMPHPIRSRTVQPRRCSARPQPRYQPPVPRRRSGSRTLSIRRYR